MIILSFCGCSIGSWTIILTLIRHLPSVFLSSWTWYVVCLMPISSHPRRCSSWSFYVVAILVAASPIWCVVLVIVFLCFCGGFLDGALSSSLHSLIWMVANIFWFFFGILCLWAYGIECQFFNLFCSVFCHFILHLSSRCLFVMVLAADCAPFPPILLWCIRIYVPLCIVPVVWIMWLAKPYLLREFGYLRYY